MSFVNRYLFSSGSNFLSAFPSGKGEIKKYASENFSSPVEKPNSICSNKELLKIFLQYQVKDRVKLSTRSWIGPVSFPSSRLIFFSTRLVDKITFQYALAGFGSNYPLIPSRKLGLSSGGLIPTSVSKLHVSSQRAFRDCPVKATYNGSL